MNPGVRTEVLPSWLLKGDYDESASDRPEGVYLKKTGFRRWEWFVNSPTMSTRGWTGWAPTLKQAWHNSFILAANPGGVAWINDATGFPG